MKVQNAEQVIATLYLALKREGWEKGPTVNDAIEEAHSWFYNRNGYESGSPDEYYRRCLSKKPRRAKARSK